MDEIDRAARVLAVTLNSDQRQALVEILESIAARRTHLLTGAAGTGKTTVLQVLAIILKRRKKRFALTAPTHKAVAVLASKLKRARIQDVQCVTTHSLLSLTPKPHGDRMVFERREFAPPVLADVVAIDESSMLGRDMMGHTRRWLPNSVVLFVGDPAQLPPVGEAASEAFLTPDRSHLDEVVRQEKDNPVLAAAYAIRDQQGGPMDWSWLKPARHGKKGIYMPGPQTDAWLRKAFTSPDFDADPDTFRYLAWTNARVAKINAKIRAWRYGEVDTPFVPGEHALLRAPVVKDDTILANTNEEPTVLAIEASAQTHVLKNTWEESVETWRVRLRNDEGLEFDAHLVRNQRGFEDALARIADAAKRERRWWKDFHAFKAKIVPAQSIYAMTVHNSQGSTHKHDFIDIGDIARRAETNLLEAQQLLYVAASRPTHTLNAVGL